MDSRQDPAPAQPLRALTYSESPPSPFRPADMVCHVVFAAGVGLLMGGWSAVFYNYASFFLEWFPHIITVGAFMAALVVSLRLGRVFK